PAGGGVAAPSLDKEKPAIASSPSEIPPILGDMPITGRLFDSTPKPAEAPSSSFSLLGPSSGTNGAGYNLAWGAVQSGILTTNAAAIDSSIRGRARELAQSEPSRVYFEQKRKLEELQHSRQILSMKIAAEKID